MAIHIQTNKNNINDETKNAKIQSVPCKIYADIEAPISTYFEPYVKPTKDDLLKGTFRGYPLTGKKIQVPEGYVGLVLHESMRPLRDIDERKFFVANKFTEITYWNWDKTPSRNDAFVKALDWIDIAEALHSPVIED